MVLMTKAQYAEHRGISRPAVSKLVRNGRLIITPEGYVDVEMSDLILDNFANESQGTRVPHETPTTPATVPRKTKSNSLAPRDIQSLISGMTGDVDYNSSRALLTRYMAELKKIELDKEQGRSISIDIVAREAFECARRTRDAIIAIEDRIADLCAAESDRAKIKALINQEHRQALEELANMPEITKQIEKQTEKEESQSCTLSQNLQQQH